MNSKGKEIREAIERELESWPDVTAEFVESKGHPKVKLKFGDLMMPVTFAGTPSSGRSIHHSLADVRRALRKMDAVRDKPDPTKEEDEATYHKPNDGADKRPHPVEGERAEPKPDIADQLVAAGAATADQAEAARGVTGKVVNQITVDDPELTDEEAEREAELARLQAMIDSIEDGVYFGLPDTVYHAVPRLSASGLQRLCVSPATFWRGSWLDPDRPELDEEETKAQQLGKAYHVARLEPERFHATYVRELDKADFPAKGFLSSDEKVKQELKARGLQQTVSGESMADRAERLLDDGFEGTCFTLEKARWEASVNGRVPIPAKYFDQIATDMERLRASDDIADLLSGGEAEVSIFWTDRYGLKMKARVDYLTPGWWDDFKTFDNSRGKELEQALADAVRYNRYHVQAVTYRDAVEAIRLGGLQIKGEATEPQRSLVAGIQIRPDELACWYIFQEKGGVPNLLAMDFPFYTVPLNTKLGHAGASEEAIARVEAGARVKSGLHIRAIQDIDKAKRDFVLYAEVYEPGQPWSPIEAVRRFSDQHFNRYWLEGAQS